MLVDIESKGSLFFRNVDVKVGSELLANIRFNFSLLQKAKITLKNSVWIFEEVGFMKTSQRISDYSTNEIIITSNLNIVKQINKSYFVKDDEITTINLNGDILILKQEQNSQKYSWFRNGITTNISYDLTKVFKSHTKLFPRLRGMWVMGGTLPDNPEKISLALFFVGLIGLINRITYLNHVD